MCFKGNYFKNKKMNLIIFKLVENLIQVMERNKQFKKRYNQEI